MDWDSLFMELATVIAKKSKDNSRKVGCVFVGPDHEILSMGYNGFPRGVNDDVAARHERPAKYLYTVHSEANAIANAARVGVSLRDATVYVPWYPCAPCAGQMVNAGVKRIVCYAPDWNDPKYGPDFAATREILDESDTQVDFMDGKSPEQKSLVTRDTITLSGTSL